MASAIWLLRGDYASFVDGQQKAEIMSRDQWVEWQSFVEWTGMNKDLDMVHALLVFLALRGLGKQEMIARRLPRKHCAPELVVLHLLETKTTASAKLLSDESLVLVTGVLRLQAKFNLAQMLQGENTPHHIEELSQMTSVFHGDKLLKFYLFAIVGFMSGILGNLSMNSSLFMSEENGGNVLLGIQCLQHLHEASPVAIYWNYICARARRLQLAIESPEQLAIARLACLVRVSLEDRETMHQSWNRLTMRERTILTDHFLSDGIRDGAFMFAFLPQFFANCCGNPCIGLSRSLVVLIELICLLRSDGLGETDGIINTIIVNLSDLANFTREVQCAPVFEAVIRHVNFTVSHTETVSVAVTVSVEHWQCANQTSWRDEPHNEVASMLRKLDRKTEASENHLDNLVQWIGPDCSKAGAAFAERHMAERQESQMGSLAPRMDWRSGGSILDLSNTLGREFSDPEPDSSPVIRLHPSSVRLTHAMRCMSNDPEALSDGVVMQRVRL